MNETLIQALVAPAITTVLGAAFALVRQWWQSRDREQRQRRDLAQAREEIAFIEAWWTARDKIMAPGAEDDDNGARARASAELDSAHHLARRSAEAARHHRQPPTLRQVISRVTLLPRATGWGTLATVLLYWPSLLWALAWAVVGSQLTVQDGLTVGVLTLAVFMIIALGLLPVILVRMLTIHVDQSRAAHLELLAAQSKHRASPSDLDAPSRHAVRGSRPAA